MRRSLILLALSVCLLGPGSTYAQQVVPTDRVTTRVIVRASATGSSADIGSLRPGEQLEYVSSVPYWHEVLLTDGTPGFVSKSWTRIVPVGFAGDFTLDFADVGTGLAVLVRGEDFTLIFDGGSNDDLARGADNRFRAYIQEVAPALETIDHVILSHPHRDHVELLPDLFPDYEIEEVWDTGAFNDICWVPGVPDGGTR